MIFPLVGLKMYFLFTRDISHGSRKHGLPIHMKYRVPSAEGDTPFCKRDFSIKPAL